MSKILLVEDDEFLRSLYVDLLKEAKCDVTVAEDGEAAFEKIKMGDWDLVLLDVMLPKMTGIEVVAKLEGEEPKALKQKIVFMSNADDEKTMKDISSTGLQHLLKSAMTPEEFIKKIQTLL